MSANLLRSSAATALLSLTIAPCSAQTLPKDQEPASPRWLTLAFEQRTRFEELNHPFRVNEGGAKRTVVLRTRFQVEIRELIEPLRFYLELQDSRSAYNDEPFLSAARHKNRLDIKQLQVRVVSDRFSGKELPTLLQIGRFTMDLGKRRFSARNRTRNTTNAFDGLYWRLERQDKWTLQTFLTRPVTIRPEELDSSNSGRYFWGGYLQIEGTRSFQTDVYTFGVHENERTSKQRKYTMVGGRVYRNPTPGNVDYEIESSWQFGTREGRDHFAHFQHGELGYVADSRWRPRLSFHYDYASGDSDPEDGRFDRFDTLFGDRRFELPPTGIYSPFARSNLHTSGVRIAVVPSRPLEVMFFYRAFWLAEAKDAWVGSGLHDPTGRSGSFLGNHIEARARWRPLRHVLIDMGYAHFFKGSYLARVPESPRNGDSDYFYIAADVRAPLLGR